MRLELQQQVGGVSSMVLAHHVSKCELGVIGVAFTVLIHQSMWHLDAGCSGTKHLALWSNEYNNCKAEGRSTTVHNTALYTDAQSISYNPVRMSAVRIASTSVSRRLIRPPVRVACGSVRSPPRCSLTTSPMVRSGSSIKRSRCS